MTDVVATVEECVDRAIARVGSRIVWLGAVVDPDDHTVGLMAEVPVG